MTRAGWPRSEIVVSAVPFIQTLSIGKSILLIAKKEASLSAKLVTPKPLTLDPNVVLCDSPVSQIQFGFLVLGTGLRQELFWTSFL